MPPQHCRRTAAAGSGPATHNSQQLATNEFSVCNTVVTNKCNCDRSNLLFKSYYYHYYTMYNIIYKINYLYAWYISECSWDEVFEKFGWSVTNG